MIKTAFLDLTYTSFWESYAINRSRYGGWSSIFSYFKEFSNCFLISDARSFDEIDETKENRANLITIDENARNYIKAGNPLKHVLPQLEEFDIIINPHITQFYNFEGLKAKNVCIDLGVYQTPHPNYQYLLLYSKEQFTNITNTNAKIFYFQLGIPIEPVFKPAPKEDYLFCCSRLCKLMNSIEIANFCKTNQIKGYFAGPIYENYPFMGCVDNKYVFYLGQITNSMKNNCLKKARLSPNLINWPSPFSLSSLEALSLGCPIAHVPLGNWWSTIIKEGKNGFACQNNDDLLRAWHDAKNINPIDCYRSALPYNHLSMLDSLFRALDEVYKCK